MELLLALSILGNILSTFAFYFLLKEKVSVPKPFKNILPFVEPMKDSDQHDLSEVDDEVLKGSVKQFINKGVVSEEVDDEEVAAKAKEFMI